MAQTADGKPASPGFLKIPCKVELIMAFVVVRVCAAAYTRKGCFLQSPLVARLLYSFNTSWLVTIDALLFVAAQTGNPVQERIPVAYQWKLFGIHSCTSKATENIMSKIANGEHTTTDRLAENAHGSVDQIAKTAGRAEERIRHDAAEVKQNVREASHKAREKTDESLHAITVFVRDNPLVSLGLAFGAGTLLSALRRH